MEQIEADFNRYDGNHSDSLDEWETYDFIANL